MFINVQLVNKWFITHLNVFNGGITIGRSLTDNKFNMMVIIKCFLNDLQLLFCLVIKR